MAAAVAGTALHQTVQTAHFIQQWHQHSAALWKSQWQIDGQLHAELTDLESTMLLLGDQQQSVNQRIPLKCAWNYTSFFVISTPWNQSLFTWCSVKHHFLCHVNLSVQLFDLEWEIRSTFSEKLHKVSGLSLLPDFTEHISSLVFANDFFYGKMGIVILIVLTLCLFELCLCLVQKQIKRYQAMMQHWHSINVFMPHNSLRRGKRKA